MQEIGWEIGYTVGGQQDDDSSWVLLEDPASGLDPADPRQPHIHQNDVRLQRAGQLDGALAVSRLPDDDVALSGLEDRASRDPERKLVVHEQDPQPLWVDPKYVHERLPDR